jgi:hypothetical protein
MKLKRGVLPQSSYSDSGHLTICRMAVFYMLSLTIAGFAPILAYALSKLDGEKIKTN